MASIFWDPLHISKTNHIHLSPEVSHAAVPFLPKVSVLAIIPSVQHRQRGTVVSGCDKMCCKSRSFLIASTTRHPMRSLVHLSSAIFLSTDFCHLFAPSSFNVSNFCFAMGLSNWLGSSWHSWMKFLYSSLPFWGYIQKAVANSWRSCLSCV